ncbi:MAG: hypothetical protein SVJ22_05035 [Halobacteriota archaeon]|nr:hypothetical protein [Halobacteriota archaeon]
MELGTGLNNQIKSKWRVIVILVVIAIVAIILFGILALPSEIASYGGQTTYP